MVTPIVMPKFGQMTEDSAIVEWLKKEGDAVAKGDVLFLVETDKSVMEVESFAEGTLLKIAVGVGVSVPVQSVVAYLGEQGETVPATPALARPAPARFRISPRAAALAKECVIDAHAIVGGAPEGRIIEKDVKAHLAACRTEFFAVGLRTSFPLCGGGRRAIGLCGRSD